MKFHPLATKSTLLVLKQPQISHSALLHTLPLDICRSLPLRCPDLSSPLLLSTHDCMLPAQSYLLSFFFAWKLLLLCHC